MFFNNYKKIAALTCLVFVLITCAACGQTASPDPAGSPPPAVEPSPSGDARQDLPETGAAVPGEAAEARPAQTLTMEQARDLLYENYVDAELFYPGELDRWEGDALLYCFVYDDGGGYRYVWVDSVTGEVEFADEIENYTGED